MIAGIDFVSFQRTPYAAALLVTGVFMFLLGLYMWGRSAAHARTAVMLLWGCVIWILGYAAELASFDEAAKIFWDKVQFIGTAPIPVLWFVFVCQFCERPRWLNRRTIIIVGLFPLVTAILTFTNELHGLIWLRAWTATNFGFRIFISRLPMSPTRFRRPVREIGAG